jgi:hypothetical protein
MSSVMAYQDDLSCVALLARGRSEGERTRDIEIRYFWMKDREDRSEATIMHKGTLELYANRGFRVRARVIDWVSRRGGER